MEELQEPLVDYQEMVCACVRVCVHVTDWLTPLKSFFTLFSGGAQFRITDESKTHFLASNTVSVTAATNVIMCVNV